MSVQAQPAEDPDDMFMPTRTWADGSRTALSGFQRDIAYETISKER
jgi:hypothetical protein